MKIYINYTMETLSCSPLPLDLRLNMFFKATRMKHMALLSGNNQEAEIEEDKKSNHVLRKLKSVWKNANWILMLKNNSLVAVFSSYVFSPWPVWLC
uniref:Uncharacterized protein n=1 Tax=Tanacetum cinerariifolium TaxID=118510 RepID=A0A6L2LAA0_TANCI|nr:hypothetical protein [Tanacetum cinerariifolium]